MEFGKSSNSEYYDALDEIASGLEEPVRTEFLKTAQRFSHFDELSEDAVEVVSRNASPEVSVPMRQLQSKVAGQRPS